MVYRNDVPNSQNEKLFMTKNEITSKLNALDQRISDLLFSLKPIPQEKLNIQPKENAWSVLQIVHHLILAEEGSLKYLKKKLSFNPKLNKVSLSSKLRLKLLTTWAYTPVKFKAPDAIGGEALPTQSTLEEVSNKWKIVRADMRAFLSKLPDDILDKEVYKHPFAGKLSLEGMLTFFEAHLDRHEKQIRRTLKLVG